MPNYAVTATPRVLWDYLSAGVQHRIQVRRPRDESSSTSLTAARSLFVAVFGALQPLLPTDFAWIQELYIPQDDDTASNSGYTGPGSLVGAMDPADYTPAMKVTATTFVGKGTRSKTKLSVFGVFWDPSAPAGPAANGRVSTGESVPIATCVTSLNGATRTYAIDGTVATFSGYANIKVNDDLLAKVRRGVIS